MALEPFLESVRRTRLSNGLTLLTREERGRGVVAIKTWVRAGYFHEPDEVAGMAHLFEHMFFKGSKRFPGADEISTHVTGLGGYSNAGTIYDSTNYYFVLPSDGFAKGMEIQADAIANPLFDPEELKREAEVVIEESNRKFDNPPAVATERMFANAFTRHRMRRWRIGSNDVLRNIRREDLLAFFQTLYRPSNIIVSVAGDVPQQKMIEIAESTFGTIPEGELRKERGPDEPPQEEFRFGESFADIQQGYSVFGWHTPGENHEDEEALVIAASILGAGRYSRLFRSAVAPDAASSVSAFNSVYEDVGMFIVRGAYDPAKRETTERRIMEGIERFKQWGPVAYELELARNRIEAAFVFELEDVLGQADTLAYFEARGGYEKISAHLDRIAALDAERIREVVNRYLQTENLTLFRHLPHGVAPSTRESALELLRGTGRDALESPPEIPLPEIAAGFKGATSKDSTRSFVLSNGMSLYVRERMGTPAVSMAIYFRGGRVRENTSNAGITQLMARSMRRGTRDRSGEEIDREIELLGTQIGLVVDEDFFGFKLEVLRKFYEPAAEILADVVLAPVFPEEKIAEEQHLQIASIRRALDSSSARPFQLLFGALYGPHPYGLPDGGFVPVIESLGRDDLVSWYEGHIVADGATIVVTGDVDSEGVRDSMERVFGRLGKSRGLHRPLTPPVEPGTRLETIEVRDRKQTAIAIAFPSVPPSHPDWAVLRLLQDVASGAAGRLYVELRSKRSLAYSVYAGDSSRELAGAFVAYIATEAGKEEEARRSLLDELQRLGGDGTTEEGITRAKAYLAGSTKIHLQTNAALAGEIARSVLYGLGLDFTERFLERIHAISLDEIRDIAKKYLQVDNYVVAIVRGRS
ncbi:MAG: pitrilysin family protein [Thermoanaerobaculia bacterium]